MDFSLILFICLAVTGVISLAYSLVVESRNNVAMPQPAISDEANPASGQQPVIVEYARALFPVILIVFVLRSFIMEPFRIPSGSMLPSLHIGDFILVNKFSYGIRLPVVNKKIIDVSSPERGEVMVFRFPKNPKLNFIKRVIGLPGDSLRYQDKQLYINDQKVILKEDGEYAFQEKSKRGRTARQLVEVIDESSHQILIDDSVSLRDNMEVTVPEGHYFVMGDNRDHSNDSRFWRFVPEENVVGKAFFIWFSWKSATGGGVEWSRIGNSIN